MNSPVVIFDSSALCYAAKYSMPELLWENQSTGIIFHYLNQILRFSTMFKTGRFVFSWDSRGNYRKNIFSEYKEKRHTGTLTDEEFQLHDQIKLQMGKLCYELLPEMGFRNVFQQKGIESDDIMASVVLNNQEDFIMVTSDNDMFQMLPHCRIFLFNKKKLFTKEDFFKLYGIEAEKWADVKALAGCEGDEVPGIQGVGLKTAIKYLNGELKASGVVYNRINSPEGRAIIARNNKLVKLPFEGTDKYMLQDDEIDVDAIIKICDEYGCYSLTNQENRKKWKLLANPENFHPEVKQRQVSLLKN